MTLHAGIKAVLLDLDGVVWRGDTAIPGAAATIRRLRDGGRRVVFVTNNSSRTRADYAAKLARMDVPADADDVVTSGDAVAGALHRQGVGNGALVYVLGSEALMRTIAGHGLVTTDEESDDVKGVCVGWKPDLTFDDLRKAANLVRSGLPFVAANADATYPAEGQLLPGTGALVAAVEVASGRRCTVAGKPEPHLFRVALDCAGVAADAAVFVGDRADTDVVGAKAAGIAAVLVLTGVTTRADLDTLPMRPDLIIDSLQDLLDPADHGSGAQGR